MKRIYKSSLVLMLLPFLLDSCLEEVADQTGQAEPADCQNIYFQELADQNIELEPSEEKELTFKVYRQAKENPEELTAVKVPVEFQSSRLESGEKAFSLTEIAFEEGQLETEFTVKFPEAKVGVTYDCAIAVTDPEFVSEYSKDQTRLIFNVTRVQWIPVKSEDGENMGLFCDGLVCEMLTGLEPFVKKPVKIERRADKKGIYRIQDLYNDEYLARMLGVPAELLRQTGIKLTPSAVVIDARNPKKVIWQKGSIGVDIGYGDISFFSMIPEYYPDMLPSEALYGTMSDGIIKFPPRAIGFETGSLTSVLNMAGKTRIIFPGYEDIDYDLSIKAGMSDAEGILPVTITKGKDIKKIKYTVLQGELPPLGIVKSANKIGDGTLEAETLADKAKKIDISMEKTGVYTVVFAGFDKDGKYVANAGTTISYVAKGDEKPVFLNCGMIVSDKYASAGNTAENSIEIFISGKDLAEVHYGLYPKDLYDSMPEDIKKALKKTRPLSEKDLEQVNGTVWSGVIDKLQAGTEYVLLVLANNKFTEKLVINEAKTKGDFDPLQAVYFPASLQKNVSKAEFLKQNKMYLYQYEAKEDKRINLGEIKLSDGGQMEAEGKQVELINAEGIWTAAVTEDKNFKIEKDVTTFVYMDGLLYNWKSNYGKVTAELVNPETGKSFVQTAPGALTSIFQSEFMGPIPLTYVGGLTKEGHIAFMDSGEFEKEDGACLAIGLGLYTDNSLDELGAIVSVLTNFMLVREDAASETVLGRAGIYHAKTDIGPLSSRWHGRFLPVGHLTDIRPEYEAVPAEFNVSVEF